MKTRILFLGAFLCANFLFAQSGQMNPPDAGHGDLPREQVKKVAAVANRASVRRITSPAAKNPLAGGRAGVDPETVRSSTRFVVKRLTGPAYKNRKQEVRTIVYGEPRRATRRHVKTGPRYKNRAAKTGG